MLRREKQTMKKLVLIACAVAGLVGSSFAGGSATWNPYFQRWEYQNSNGTNAGNATWNQFFNRYEFTNGNGMHTGTATWNPFFHRWDYGD